MTSGPGRVNDTRRVALRDVSSRLVAATAARVSFDGAPGAPGGSQSYFLAAAATKNAKFKDEGDGSAISFASAELSGEPWGPMVLGPETAGYAKADNGARQRRRPPSVSHGARAVGQALLLAQRVPVSTRPPC